MYRDKVTLLDIWKAAQKLSTYTDGMDQAAFESDDKTQSAVLHQLMIIGEAVKRISLEFRDTHSEIPWKDIAGMRDRLIHVYDDVDIDLVWVTIQRHIPALITQLEPLIPETSED